MSLFSTLNWWVTNGILLENSTDSRFFLLTTLDHTPYRRMGMSYQVEELVVQASHMLLVLASPLTVTSCTFQMAGGHIGGLRLKTRRTA